MTTPAGHVALLATGGTISAGPAGPLNAASLIRLAASGTVGIPADVPIRGEDVERIPSSRVTVASIERLAKSIRTALQGNGCLGVVVTHGTDTLEEVAFACDLIVGDASKPIIFTGAMVPPRDKGTDAHNNLARAIRVAGGASTTLCGVHVLMQQSVHAAAEVCKLSTSSVDAFASPHHGPVGWMSDTALEVVRPTPRFDLTAPRLEPAVDLIRLTAGGGDRLIRVATPNARGLVIELFGAGNAPEVLHAAIREAIEAGVVVLACSRVRLGGLTPESGVLEAGAIPTNLDGLKARLLLMASLGTGLDADAIRRLVDGPNAPTV
ncbi:MAG: asparaginase [Planctomycetota bacterium]